MGQGTSSESQPNTPAKDSNREEPPLSLSPGPRRFSQTLAAGLSQDNKKLIYEKELAKLFGEYPDGGQEKFRCEAKGTEKNEITELLPPYKEVVWEEKQVLQDVHKDGQAQRTFRKMVRSKADIWRKYGALLKLHEIGGKAYNGPPGPKAKYFDVPPGSTPPPQPVVRALVTVDDYKPFGGLGGKPAEE